MNSAFLAAGFPAWSQALMGKRVGHVACGGFHSAAILESGELYTWGGGEHGQVCGLVFCRSSVVFFFFNPWTEAGVFGTLLLWWWLWWMLVSYLSLTEARIVWDKVIVVVVVCVGFFRILAEARVVWNKGVCGLCRFLSYP